MDSRIASQVGQHGMALGMFASGVIVLVFAESATNVGCMLLFISGLIGFTVAYNSRRLKRVLAQESESGRPKEHA